MRNPHPDTGGTRGVVKLTPAEGDVVALVARGLSNREVAASLGKSEPTVKSQLSSVYRKLGLRRRLQLIALFRP
jgi:DNA-binding CsgD family transcriptional regulator